jgi:hypothetical protein
MNPASGTLPPTNAGETVKVRACVEEWRTKRRTKRGTNELQGLTEKAYIEQCRRGGTSPVPSTGATPPHDRQSVRQRSSYFEGFPLAVPRASGTHPLAPRLTCSAPHPSSRPDSGGGTTSSGAFLRMKRRWRVVLLRNKGEILGRSWPRPFKLAAC